MMNWRTASVLLGLSSLLACAKSIDDGAPLGDSAGAANGGAPLVGDGGGYNAGAQNRGGLSGGAGAPSGAGTASGGASGHAGAGGAAIGGHSGTSSGGASGAAGAGKAGASGAAGAAGSAGGSSGGPCMNPKDVTGGNSMGFATTGPVCLRTSEPLNTVGCSNFAGRTLSVNGMPVTCTDNAPAKGPFAPAIDGYTYFDVSAGTLEYASVFWYSS
jgi:hypothetical protein